MLVSMDRVEQAEAWDSKLWNLLGEIEESQQIPDKLESRVRIAWEQARSDVQTATRNASIGAPDVEDLNLRG